MNRALGSLRDAGGRALGSLRDVGWEMGALHQMDPSRARHARYKNVVQTAALVAQEEGAGALYKGVVPTMLRQG